MVSETDPRAALGAFGEDRAWKFYREKRRARLIARNWRHGRGEIDLIVEEKGQIVFVEVRTRREPVEHSPYYSIQRKKKRRLYLTCRAFLRQHHCLARSWRYDIVGVRVAADGQCRLEHFEAVSLKMPPRRG